MDQAVFYGILIPFLGTSLGAACVFFMKHDMSERLSRILTGFAAGVMVAASIWSLLIPAMEQSEEMGKFAFIPAAAGFWGGILFLLLLDHIIPHLHRYSVSAEGPKSRLQRTTMMVLAVTLHNIPEGMAVGVVYAGYLAGNAKITVAAAMALSIGDRNPKFPGGGDYFHAAQGRRDESVKGFCRWCAFRDCGAGRCNAYNFCSRIYCSGSALSVELCSRSDDLCGCGGTDPGNVPGGTFRPWNDFFCSGIYGDDVAGCGSWVKITE